jgi:D-sedoheptulose 7-phosphate isomerase
MKLIISNYLKNLSQILLTKEMDKISFLAESLFRAWKNHSKVYICGNGGSAANANHLANDLIYGAGLKSKIGGLSVESLSANTAVITCLANDLGYDHIYSEQLKVKGKSGDLLIVLSGSGNSQNVIQALKMANQLRMETFAILGYSGGKCKEIASNYVHFEINDMQIAEDLQLIVGHICMRWLYEQGSLIK